MNEHRLIDAKNLMKTIKQHNYLLSTRLNSTDYGMFTIGIQQAVDEQPTIDPETLPIVQELRAELERVTRERDDYKIFFENITKYGDCNDCGKSVTCEFVPKVGQTTRYNCPLWTGR